MKAIWIYPEDIGASDKWSEKWTTFCAKFGYTQYDLPGGLLLSDIKTDQ